MSHLHTRTTWAALCLVTLATLATLLCVSAATTLHALAPDGAPTATPMRATTCSGTDADWDVDPQRIC